MGGWVLDYLRCLFKVLDFIRYLNEYKKIIGSICYVGWVLFSVGILKGVMFILIFGIKDDMMYVGVIWVDKFVVVDKYIVIVRRFIDLLYYLFKFIEVLLK